MSKDIALSKVFKWNFLSVFSNAKTGLTDDFMPGIKIRIILDNQSKGHTCSECEDLIVNRLTESYISLYILLESTQGTYKSFLKNYEQFNLTLSTVSNTHEILYTKTKSYTVPDDKNFKFGFCYFMSLKTFHHSLSHREMTVECKIEKIPQVTTFHIKKKSKPFQTLMNSETLSDVTLIMKNGINIPAHKFILYSKSPYFEKMFSNQNLENVSNKVPIDFEYEPFLEVLKYIYIEEVDNLETIGMEIFKIAHYYQIEDLQLVCQDFFKKNFMKKNNIIEILKLAVDYELEDFQNYCCELLIKNFHNLGINKDVILELFKSNPELGCKLFFVALETKE